MPPVICNTTPLIALWVLEKLHLFQALYGEILIPPTVASEFTTANSLLRQSALAQAPWIKSTPLKQPNQVAVFSQLDQGEAEVLALALETQAALVIIDELKARQMAQRLKLPLTGTLGILLLAKEKQLIPAIRPEIIRLENAGLRLGATLITAVLERAGEV